MERKLSSDRNRREGTQAYVSMEKDQLKQVEPGLVNFSAE